MKSKIKIGILLYCLSMARFNCFAGEFEGIPVVIQNIPDLAISWYYPTPSGLVPVIYLNPVTAQMYGQKYVMFALAHELGHHRNGDLSVQAQQGGALQVVQYRQQAEDKADKFALDYWMPKDRSVIDNAIAIMETPALQNAGDYFHKPSSVRGDQLQAWEQQWLNDHASKGSTPDPTPSAPVDMDTHPFSFFLSKTKNGFAELRDPSSRHHQGARTYDSTVPFPGATETTIYLRDGSLQATFRADGDDEMQKSYKFLAALLKSDLGNSWDYTEEGFGMVARKVLSSYQVSISRFSYSSHSDVTISFEKKD